MFSVSLGVRALATCQRQWSWSPEARAKLLCNFYSSHAFIQLPKRTSVKVGHSGGFFPKRTGSQGGHLLTQGKTFLLASSYSNRVGFYQNWGCRACQRLCHPKFLLCFVSFLVRSRSRWLSVNNCGFLQSHLPQLHTILEKRFPKDLNHIVSPHAKCKTTFSRFHWNQEPILSLSLSCKYH